SRAPQRSSSALPRAAPAKPALRRAASWGSPTPRNRAGLPRVPPGSPASSPHGRDKDVLVRSKPPFSCQLPHERPPLYRTQRRCALASGPFISEHMPEVIFPGPEGRLEGRFHPGTRPRAPVALILHSHPQAGGTMNNKIVQLLYQTFVRRGFATLRFNFRGVGKSQGVFDNGIGELSDAASALDWVQSIHPEAETTWVAGVSFGAWIGMQLLMRRPEIRGFISIAPPANMYDFSFLAPCPSSGIIIQGEADEVVTPSAVQKLVDKLRTQRHITIHHDLIPGANHFFANELDLLMKSVDDYLDMRLATDPIKPAIPSRSSRS